uniref:Uncharacterized protein n=1 Tax=Noccaea caerulescens TaxID=107243 RepID=A0A1J3FJL9_NOCCA
MNRVEESCCKPGSPFRFSIPVCQKSRNFLKTSRNPQNPDQKFSQRLLKLIKDCSFSLSHSVSLSLSLAHSLLFLSLSLTLYKSKVLYSFFY